MCVSAAEVYLFMSRDLTHYKLRTGENDLSFSLAKTAESY